MVCRRAVRLVRNVPIDPSLEDKSASCDPDLLAERVQPDPRSVSTHEYAKGVTANELLFQFLFSIGAHGAHVF